MGNCCVKNKIEPIKFEIHSLLKWESNRKTEKFHWWPMCESDIHNNLYADGNALSKYDILLNKKSVNYQREHYYISTNSSRKDKNWAGFCNYSAIMSSLYNYPIHSVLVKYNQKTINLTPSDIEQLMVIASKNSIKKNISIFFGERNNSKLKEEPLPIDLLKMLEILCNNDTPFIMDIDNGYQVWNYPFDKVEVFKYKTCPLNHIVPVYGITDYYNFKITSSEYPEQNQNLWGYVNTIYIDRVVYSINQKWITETHPDFLWAKFPINTPWNGNCIINPEVDSKIVYDIYKSSFKNNSILTIN